MKTAKFIIMLQVCFLIGVFVFSASAVYRPGNAGILTVTNLAVRQPGYEIASPEHDTYQVRLSSMDSMARAAEALKAGLVPDNAKALDIPGADSPAYLVSFLDEVDKIQFLVVLARSDESGTIAAVIEKNEQISDQLGIFAGLPPTRSIEALIADGSKASSAGTIKNLPALIRQLEHKDPSIRGKAAYAMAKIGPAAYPALDGLIKILEEDEDLSVIIDTMFAIEKIGPAAHPALDALIKLLEHDDSSIRANATLAILAIGPIAFPSLNERLKAAELKLEGLQDKLVIAKTEQDIASQEQKRYDEYVGEELWKSDDVVADVAAAEVVRLKNEVNAAQSTLNNIQNIILNYRSYAKTSKASSAGTIKNLPTLIRQLEDEASFIRKNASAVIAKVAGPAAYPALDVLIKLLEDKDPFICKNAATAVTAIGFLALPSLDERLKTADNEQAEVIRGIMKKIAPISKASSAGTIGDLPILIKQLEDEDPFIRKDAAYAISEIGPIAIDPLIARFRIMQLKNAKLELEVLQIKFATEEDSGYRATLSASDNKAGAKIRELRKAAMLAQLKLSAIRNAMEKLGVSATSKVSFADSTEYLPMLIKQLEHKDPHIRMNAIYAIPKIGLSAIDPLIARLRIMQLENAKLELEVLQVKLATEENGEYEVTLSSTYREASAEGFKLESVIDSAKSRVISLQNTIAMLATSPGKASSAGYQRDIADAMAVLSDATYAFTDVNIIPELNMDMLSKQIEMYKDAADKLENIKGQSPDAAIAVAEHLKLAQTSLNTMTAIQNLAAEDAALENVTGTIVINDKDIPDNQQILITMLDRVNPYLEALETKLGCKVRLLSQYNPKLDGAADMIAISSISVNGISRRVDINAITQDGFLPLEEVIVIAKGLLTYNQDTALALNGIIARMYRSITKIPMRQELLEAFLRNSVFVLDLPIPIAIDEAYYEQLHRQILAALIAA